MGTTCTPTYDNFMEMFEKSFIYHLILKIFKLGIYINDIFIIWIGTLDELSKFKAKINQVHSSMRFNFNYPSNNINFLDKQ